ncbi:MAG: ShlB/FhaC/HecB family hemolysin secretion/activation protein [Pseudomonadota bacterium]
MTFSFARLFSASALALATASAWAAPADGAVRFDIGRFAVSGNTLLAQGAIDAALAPFLGKQRDFGDVQRALEALEAVYHERGYNVVQVELPEQELNGGVVTLKVIEIKIGRVKVTGNTVFDEANVRRSLPALREGKGPNLKDISAGLKLANENPAKKVTMKMQGGERDDEVDVKLEVVDQKAWTASLNLDNTGSTATGKTHAGVVLQHANLLGRDDVASMQYSTTVEKPSQVSVWGAGYHLPLYALNDSLDLYASYSDVDSGTISAGLLNLAVSGKGTVFGLRYNRSLTRAEGYEPRLVFGLESKAFKNSVLFAGSDIGNDITVHPLSIGYLGSWSGAQRESNLSLTLLHNLPGGKNGKSADFAAARKGAPAGFSALRFAGTVARSLARDWQSRVIVSGQYSPKPLIPGEQFGAGGSSSVRGFDERVVSNDSGVLGNFELYTPTLCAALTGWQCRALGFVDGAYVSRNEPLPGEMSSATLASVGLGLRLLKSTNVNVQLDYGHVVHSGSSGATDKNKLHVRATLAY